MCKIILTYNNKIGIYHHVLIKSYNEINNKVYHFNIVVPVVK